MAAGVVSSTELVQEVLDPLHPDVIRRAVLGNAGTLNLFQVEPARPSILAKEFQPKFEAADLLNLPNRSISLRLMIDGMPSQPFSAECASMRGLAPPRDRMQGHSSLV